MIRTLIVIALLASLYYIVQNLQPPGEPNAAKVVAAAKVKKADVEPPGEAVGVFNPVVPESLPDVEKGYLFSEKRKIEKEVPVAEVKPVVPVVVEPGPEVLDSVTYTGSVIIGDTRRALVIFQEPAREGAAPAGRTGGGRRPGPPAATTQSPPQHKQLNPGDRLLGFAVSAIEPDRIVFEKGVHKVEKFLYDRNKKRLAATVSRSEPPPQPITTPGGIPLEAFVPPEVAAEVAASPTAAQRFMAGGGVVRPTPLGPGPDGGGQAAEQSNRMVRRSQRLLAGDSGIQVPFSPVPGRPVPKQ